MNAIICKKKTNDKEKKSWRFLKKENNFLSGFVVLSHNTMSRIWEPKMCCIVAETLTGCRMSQSENLFECPALHIRSSPRYNVQCRMLDAPKTVKKPRHPLLYKCQFKAVGYRIIELFWAWQIETIFFFPNIFRSIENLIALKERGNERDTHTKLGQG